MSYHAKMMNVPHQQSDSDTYKRGHRDARHACAEIALEADERIAALEAQLAEALELLREVRSSMHDTHGDLYPMPKAAHIHAFLESTQPGERVAAALELASLTDTGHCHFD